MGGSSETQTKQEKKADSFQYDYSVSFAGEGIYKGIYASNVGLDIIEINKMESIGKGKSVKNAQGEYLVIGIAVTNEQKDKITMDHRAFKIIDKEGRELSAAEDAVYQMKSAFKVDIFNATSINPGNTFMGYVAFDIPVGTSIEDLKLQVRGGMTGKKELLPIRVVKEGEKSTGGQQQAAQVQPPQSSSQPVQSNPPSSQPATTKPKTLVGTWNMSGGGISFSIEVNSIAEGVLVANHYATTKNGLKIDKRTDSIVGDPKGTSWDVSWKSGNSDARGRATITKISDDQIRWKITSVTVQGEHYLPPEVVLNRQ